MKSTRRLVFMALLAAMALAIYAAEAQIPAPLPVPGVKLGLANVVTLVAMSVMGRREAGAVLAVRLVLGSMFSGGLSALIFSAAGGLAAWGVMCALIGVFPGKRLWVVSVLAAIAHNFGQLMAAWAVTGTAGILYYGFALLASAIITGAFTGIAAMYLSRAAEKLINKK